MNAEKSYSSISREKKREKLMALVERRNNGEQPMVKSLDDTNSKNCAKGSMKWMKRNAHFCKKLFQIHRKKVKVLDHANDMIVKESCSGSIRKKRRLCSGEEREESFCQSRTNAKTESGSGGLSDFQFEVSPETHNHVLPYVDKLRDYWNRGQNAAFYDSQDRLVKVVYFVLSLLDNMKKPILIIASTSALSLWETEFSKCSKWVNVVTYKGNKHIRTASRDSEFYGENGRIKFQVLLSSPDAIVEDMGKLDHIKWELLVIDECQRPIFSPHFKKLQMLLADMKLLTISGELWDIRQFYQNLLSLLDCKHEKMNADADMEVKDNINTLKERMSPFIAFECKFSTPDFEEYWVPVHLSSMQIEQYCSILASNSEALSSSSRNSSLHDIVSQIQKCCDHPYLVDPTLRNSSEKASLVDPFDAEINVSGKMQLINKLLLEIKQRGLRTVIMFHSAVNSEKISTGHFLDDLVHQRFGENSYVYIPGKNLSDLEQTKKRESIKMFNRVGSERFICLFDYHACHSSVRLSRVDVVILFNSDGNPSNDIKALKRITIDSPCERLNVFRLYSAFTVEEKTLILSKQGTPLNYISWSVCHQLLAWGASYLLSKLQSCTNNGPLSFLDDVVHELSSLLTNTSVKMGPTNRSIVSNAHMQNGAYSGSMLLFGETETNTKQNSCVEEYLIDNIPSVFWSNLLKESQHRPENACNRLSRRVRKSPRTWFEDGYGYDATVSAIVRSMPRSKRKVHEKVRRKRAGRPLGSQQTCENVTDTQLPILPSTSIHDSTALTPRTRGSQLSQSDQPLPTPSSSTPLETETERIQKEREQITESHQEKKKLLLAECEKEILEVQKKYDALIHDSEISLSKELKILENYQKLVNSNKLLADILAQNWQENLDLNPSELNLNRTPKETSAVNILHIPASALIRPKNPCSASAPCSTSYLSTLAGSGLQSPPPHLMSNLSMFAAFHYRPATVEPFLEPSPTLSTPQTLPCIQEESKQLTLYRT